MNDASKLLSLLIVLEDLQFRTVVTDTFKDFFNILHKAIMKDGFV